jgi:hypothetical protein
VNRTACVVALISCISAAACAPRATGPVPRLLPIAAVSEEQDEWLHEHCEPKSVVSVGSFAEGDRVLRGNAANFGEIVYADGTMHLVAFACATRPGWSDAQTWIPLADWSALPTAAKDSAGGKPQSSIAR